MKNTDIANELTLPPVKLHCSLLAEDAIRGAVEDYQRRKLAKGEAEEGAIDDLDICKNQNQAY